MYEISSLLEWRAAIMDGLTLCWKLLGNDPSNFPLFRACELNCGNARISQQVASILCLLRIQPLNDNQRIQILLQDPLADLSNLIAYTRYLFLSDVEIACTVEDLTVNLNRP